MWETNKVYSSIYLAYVFFVAQTFDSKEKEEEGKQQVTATYFLSLYWKVLHENRRLMPVGDETHGRKCSNLLLVSLLISVSAGIDRLYSSCVSSKNKEQRAKKKNQNKNIIYVSDETIDCSQINSLFVIARRPVSSWSLRAVDADGDCGINVGRYSRKADNESAGKTKIKSTMKISIRNKKYFTDFHDEYSKYVNRLLGHEPWKIRYRIEIQLFDEDVGIEFDDWQHNEILSVDIDDYSNLLRM